MPGLNPDERDELIRLRTEVVELRATLAQAQPTAPGTRAHVTRINHTAVSVSDIRASIAFYTEVLGLRLMATQPAIERVPGMPTLVGVPEPALRAQWALLAAGASRLELVCYRSPTGRRPDGPRPPWDVGLAHLAFETDRVDELYDDLTAAGVATVSPPQHLGRHRALYAYGPDGEILELLEEYSPDPPHAELED